MNKNNLTFNVIPAPACRQGRKAGICKNYLYRFQIKSFDSAQDTELVEVSGMTRKNGFTLIELLVVMAIMAILTMIAVTNFRNVQIKARDASRKSDLSQLKGVLELYYNDYASYPDASAGGLIEIGNDSFAWKTSTTAGVALTDDKTVYMKELVGDPSGDPNYCYKSDGSSYQIYAKLENSNDPKIGSYTCGGDNIYNYGVASPNSTP